MGGEASQPTVRREVTDFAASVLPTHTRIGRNWDSEESKDEICPYHLRGRCSWGSNCQNVHCDLPYQWRWRRRGSRDWTVFSEDENEGIERAFCDPTNETHFVLKHGLTIDFNSMSAIDSLDLQVEIERLSTPSSVNNGNQTWRTKWLWYWKNPKGEWIKFGDLDNYQGCKAEIRSADLEEAFVADPTGEVNFKTTGAQSLDYIVNFRDMTQRNATYPTTRELRRRPEFTNKLNFELNHLRLGRNAGNAVNKEIKAPANWSMPTWKDLSEHIALVKLKESDPEYGEIKSLFLKSLQNVDIKSIDRIENGDLWENYMMNKSKMLKKKNGGHFAEKRVFHGTKDKFIAAICKQGFDFRLNGQTTGTVYGKGCYFATNSSYSNNYAENGTDKSMFVAKILQREYVCGTSSNCRPPHKNASDQTSDLYDSWLGNVNNPSIFVKFDNNQIYPEFLIRYTQK